MAAHSEALGWIAAIGQAMVEIDQNRVANLHAKIDVLFQVLLQKPETLDELKVVLNTVAEIQSSGLEIELEYQNLEEQSRIRDLYGIINRPEDVAQTYSIQTRWVQLELEARSLSISLQQTMRKFTEITKSQVIEFSKEVATFYDQALQKGPAKCNDLDAGEKLLEEYQMELVRMQSKREQLVLAQRLFGLPLVPFPMIVEVENFLKKLSQIYTIYSDFKSAVDKFSKTLWVDLDIQRIVVETEDFSIRLKKIRNLKTEKPYINLEAKLKGFQDSLPLIQDLKSQALRPRHWEKLMKETGKSFDMDPNLFTLENLFQMELHNFTSVIRYKESGCIWRAFLLVLMIFATSFQRRQSSLIILINCGRGSCQKQLKPQILLMHALFQINWLHSIAYFSN
eukprot:c18873_g1_i1 orf=354-1541(+)